MAAATLEHEHHAGAPVTCGLSIETWLSLMILRLTWVHTSGGRVASDSAGPVPAVRDPCGAPYGLPAFSITGFPLFEMSLCHLALN